MPLKYSWIPFENNLINIEQNRKSIALKEKFDQGYWFAYFVYKI